MRMERRFPVGAELRPDRNGTLFRVWAPKSQAVSVILSGPGGGKERRVALEREAGEHGYFSGMAEGPDAGPGARYRYQLDAGVFPDPASRYQPEGPHGPSEVVAADFPWTDAAWRGRPAREIVLYELHVGTFTPEGTWRAAMEQLPELAQLGVTAIEMMPVAEMPGKFGWGYDGVDIFAPTRLYGRPDDLKAFIDRAHALGLMVILDVVYNHLGPDGNFLRQFADDYFSEKYDCEWGHALNFEGERAAPAREFFTSNAAYWISEYHFDGLRLDATQQIFDASPQHLVASVAEAARAAAPDRQLYLIGENEPQHGHFVRPATEGGYGLDALWNDDFHHSALVAATGKAECYFTDYQGTAQEFISAAKYGFLFQGGWCRWQRKRRGTPALDLQPLHFVNFLQNHDQIANTLLGLRLHQVAAAGTLRALTALTLLLPSTPMLFQGQEFAASAPFLYFADHHAELSALVAEGRRKFLGQFRSIASADARDWLHDPADPAMFARCKLDFSEREKHRGTLLLHADLLRLRREETTLREPEWIDGAVLAEQTFVLRFFAEDGEDRLLLVNLGTHLGTNSSPEPLLAPLADCGWRVLWSSESPVYGGSGTPELETTSGWIIPGQSAFVLAPDGNPQPVHARLDEGH